MEITVNGRKYNITSNPWRPLLDVLRYELGLTGSKEGCSSGSCGACTVLMDGHAVNACLVLMAEAEGKEIITIEGVSKNGQLHPLQQAFMDEGAVQCGFCTPGMILSGVAFLNANPQPTENQVRVAMAGNLCRCTGYDKIIRAVMSIADKSDKGGV